MRLILAIYFLLLLSSAQARNTYKIGALFPLGGVWPAEIQTNGLKLQSLLNITCDAINKDLIGPFGVSLDCSNTEPSLGEQSTSIQAAMNLVAKNVTAVISGIAGDWTAPPLNSSGVPHISWGSTFPSLTGAYQYFMRTVPPITGQAKAIADLLIKSSFKDIALIGDDDSYHICPLVAQEARALGINVRAEQYALPNTGTNFTVPLLKVLNSGARVYILCADTTDAPQILQTAASFGMTSAGFVWISSTNVTGMPSELLTPALQNALRGSLGIGLETGTTPLFKTLLDIWRNKNPVEFPGAPLVSDERARSVIYSAQLVDAVVALATVLGELERANITVTADTIISQLKTHNSTSTAIIGATVEVMFRPSGDVTNEYDILNFQNNTYKVVGTYIDGVFLNVSQIIWANNQTTQPTGAPLPVLPIAALFPLNPLYGDYSHYGSKLLTAYKAICLFVNSLPKFSTKFTINCNYWDDDGYTAENCNNASQKIVQYGALGVVGPANSGVAEVAAKVLGPAQITQILYSATSAEISNKTNYPYVLRTVPSDLFQESALADLLSFFNWKRIAIIGTDDVYSRPLIDGLVPIIQKRNITVLTRILVPSNNTGDISSQMLQIKNSGARIILIVGTSDFTAKVFKKASDNKMTGLGWGYIGSDGAMSFPLSTLYNDRALALTMEGVVGLLPNKGFTDVYADFVDFWQLINQTYPGAPAEYSDADLYVGQMLDSVLTFAYAFSNMLNKNATINGNTMLQNVHAFTNLTTGFEGATGRIYFNSNGDRPNLFYDVVNLVGYDYLPVGSWDPSGLTFTTNIAWPGGSTTPPSDIAPPPTPVTPHKPKEHLSASIIAVIIIIIIVMCMLILDIYYYLCHRRKWSEERQMYELT